VGEMCGDLFIEIDIISNVKRGPDDEYQPYEYYDYNN